MMDDGEDPEVRCKRMEAEQNGSDLGTVIGLTIGSIMALTTEEQEIHDEQEFNEYYVEEETWQQTM